MFAGQPSGFPSFHVCRREAAHEPQTAVTQHLASIHLNEWSASMFPTWLREDAAGTDGSGARRSNLSPTAHRYLERLNLTIEDLIHHVLAVLHEPAYRTANADALRMGWPRVPLPHWTALSARTGTWEDSLLLQAEEAADALVASVARGRELACLLDPDTPVPGVTIGQLRPEIAAMAVPATTHGHNMFGDDFDLTAGWGHFGSG